MELKKSDKANLEKKRGMFIEIGLLISLGVVLFAFEVQSEPRTESFVEATVEAVVEVDQVPITRQDEPPPPAPPAPPQVTDILNIVSDDAVVETSISIDVEATAETVIEIVEFKEVAAVQEEEEEILFSLIEEAPLFNGLKAEEGFRRFVSENMVYPAVAQENGVMGTVVVEFVINSRGELVDAKILRGVDPTLDNEALRVIKSSPKWTPGKQRDKAVRVKYTFPVVFRLQN